MYLNSVVNMRTGCLRHLGECIHAFLHIGPNVSHIFNYICIVDINISDFSMISLTCVVMVSFKRSQKPIFSLSSTMLCQ